MTDKQYKLPFEGYFSEVLGKMRALAENIERMPLKQRLEEIGNLEAGVSDCYGALSNAEKRYRREAPGYVAPELRPELNDPALTDGVDVMRRLREYNKEHLPPEALEIHDFRNSLPLLEGMSASLLARIIMKSLRNSYRDRERDLERMREGNRLWQSEGLYIDSAAYWDKVVSRVTHWLEETRRKPLNGIEHLTDEEYNRGVRIIDEEFAKLTTGGSK